MLFGRALLLAPTAEAAERCCSRRPKSCRSIRWRSTTLPTPPSAAGIPHAARRALLDYRALEGDDPDARRRAAFAVRLADLSMQAGDPARAVAGTNARLDSSQRRGLLVKLAEARWRARTASGQPRDRDCCEKPLEKDPVHTRARARVSLHGVGALVRTAG